MTDAKNLDVRTFKEDETACITGLLSKRQTSFVFFVMNFFLCLQSALSPLQILSYNLLFCGVSFATLSKPSTFPEYCALHYGDELKVDNSKFSTRSTFICKAKGKGGVMLFQLVLTIQGISLKVKKCLTGFGYVPPWCQAELGCEATVQGSGTVNPSTCISSSNVKSVSEKCWLQTYCLGRACQVSPPIAEPCVKLEPENTKTKLLFLWFVSSITFLLPGELHMLHKLFTVCCFGYNTLVQCWFLLNTT